MHSTRGGAATPELEEQATVNWFLSPRAEVSAHAVVGVTGTITECVADDLIAWHAREYNVSWLGLELVQPHIGDPITTAQYTAAAWWLIERAKRFGFALTEDTLPEHRQVPPGVRDRKTDVGAPYDQQKLLAAIRRWQEAEEA